MFRNIKIQTASYIFCKITYFSVQLQKLILFISFFSLKVKHKKSVCPIKEQTL